MANKKQNMVCTIKGVMTEETIKQISNGTLRTQLRTVISCAQVGNKASWQSAYTVHRIIHGETYKDDFGKLSTLAEFMQTNKSRMSEQDNAIQYLIRNNLLPYKEEKGKVKPVFIDIPTTVQTAYELSKIAVKRTETEEGEKLDSYADFCTFINNDKPYLLSNRAVKDAIKAWKKSLEPAQLTDSTDNTDSTDSTDNTDSKPTKIDALSAIAKAMTEYNITVDELIEYLNDNQIFPNPSTAQ